MYFLYSEGVVMRKRRMSGTCYLLYSVSTDETTAPKPYIGGETGEIV